MAGLSGRICKNTEIFAKNPEKTLEEKEKEITKSHSVKFGWEVSLPNQRFILK